MNRRDVLQLSALAPLAGLADGMPPAAARIDRRAATGSAFASARSDHVAIRVRDFDAALAWYGRVLGFREERRWDAPPHVGGGLRLAYLRLNDLVLEIVGDGATPDAGRAPPTSIPDLFSVRGYNHLCLRVADLARAKAELEANGVVVYAGPNRNDALDRSFLHFHDVEGAPWELVQLHG